MENDKLKELEETLINSIKKREELSKENIKKAELIGFKNFPDEVIITDQYGFIKDNKNE
jgi:hypothetical protein